VLIWIAADVTTLLIYNRLVWICLAKSILMLLFFVFKGKMSKWQVVTHRQSQAAAAAASSTTFSSLAFSQDPFSDQMNQSNDNQQTSKASGAPVLIWIAVDVTTGSKKATT
jgi:ABC-type transport system involved in Fe-S cluster assembly fused permease/ATPase subunit